LSTKRLGRLHETATRFVRRSKVLASLMENVEVTRGRFYFWRDETDLMARITPLSSVTFLLEAPRGNGWVEHARGTFRVVLGALERDRFEGFHGMGALARKSKVTAARRRVLDRGLPDRHSRRRDGSGPFSSACAALPRASRAAR
jgi:hypothetical protein